MFCSRNHLCVCMCVFSVFTFSQNKKRRRPRAASDLIRATLVNRRLETLVKLKSALSVSVSHTDAVPDRPLTSHHQQCLC
ncbi:hypothetical protein FJTKL_02551 [Diaporthe vaccinii]|uniref:Secreted protein n=1 Tax=Diaporthe vaccinii TaxID=105482 RepID=A0ABR4DY72_9PEZI